MGEINSLESVSGTAEGRNARWRDELEAARKVHAPWWRLGDRIVKRFAAEKADTSGDREAGDYRRLNLFSANVTTQLALLYGKIPTVNVDRRFVDIDDDAARVAGEMLERLLNTDIERDGDGFATSVELALLDRLMPGLGTLRLRYTVELEDVPEVPAIVDPTTGVELAPAVPATARKVSEDVETDYVHWKDQLWSPARTFRDVRWWAFKLLLTQDELTERFGAEKAQMAVKRTQNTESGEHADIRLADPYARAEVWEIWDKEGKSVHWFAEGCSELLDSMPDPLGLEGFWPFPRPLMANPTTTAYAPTADWKLAEDQYLEIDDLTDRISMLTQALRVAGVYDASNTEIKQLLTCNGENQLIPVSNWAVFAESGGLKGAIDWFPLEQVAGTLERLVAQRANTIDLLYQVTGMSDILRGQSSSRSTATEQAIKAKFASVRMQASQDEVARFATDAQRIRAEIIVKHFDDQTILERSNFQRSLDSDAAQDALRVLRDQFFKYRIQIKSENLSYSDYAVLKQERVEFVQALAGFFQSSAPLVQLVPQTLPSLMRVLQWSLAGTRGGQEIEGIFDKAIDAVNKAYAEKMAQQQAAASQPSPEAQQAMFEARTEGQKAQFEAKTAGQKAQFDAKAKAQQTILEHQLEVDRAAKESQNKLVESAQQAVVDERKQAMEALRGPSV